MKNGISIFIPVFNEADLLEKNTRRLIDYLQALETPFELIIGSNGSFDQTLELCEKLAEEFAFFRYFHIPEKAPGTAFKNAIGLCNYDILITQDMDLSTDITFIDKARRLIAANHIVIGAKLTGRQNRTVHRILLSSLFIRLVKILLGLEYRDYSLGAKAYQVGFLSKYADTIKPGTFYVLELVYIAQKTGLSVTEIPVDCNDTRKSRFNLINESIFKFYHLIKFSLNNRN